MHTPYTPSQRQTPQGQTFIPPPPPPPPQQAPPPQTHGIPLPPPPPRPSGSMPRTPGGANANEAYTWAGAPWPRQLNYPPPPPLGPGQGPSQGVATYNPGAYYNYQNTSQTPSNVTQQPTMLATFVPGPMTWGIGVGIPGWEEHKASSNYDPVARDDSYNINVPFDDGTHSPVATRDDPNSATQTRPMASPPFQSFQNGHRPSAPVDAQAALAAQWTLEHVIALLKANHFSAEWQDTFKQLDLHGSKFLDLGKQNAGKGPSLMYSTINPKLCEITKGRNMAFDQHQAREEGKRLRKLVRGINQNGGVPMSSPFMRQRGSTIDQGSTPSTANDADSPGKQMPPVGSLRQHSVSQPRAPSTAAFPPPAGEAPEMMRSRSAFTQSTLAGLEPAAAKRHSPSGSATETSAHSPTATDYANSSRTISESSPQPASAKPNSMPGRYYNNNNSHHRVTSSDASLNLALNGITGLSDPSRMSFNGPAVRGTDRRRPSVAEPHVRNSSAEGTSGTKEHRNIMGKFRIGKRKDESGPATTFDQMGILPSPSSPSAKKTIFDGSNSSDTLLTRPRGDTNRNSGRLPLASKKFVLLTPDGWNYRLLDVSGVEQPDDFRNLVRYTLQMPAEVTELPIYMTSPGQTDFHESLSDIQVSQCLLGADKDATLKLYVKTPYTPGFPSGFSTASQLAPSPFAPANLSGRSIDEATLRQLEPAALAPRKHTVDMDAAQNSMPDGLSKEERDRELKQRMEEYRRGVERKQAAYHGKRASRIGVNGQMAPINFDDMQRRESLNDEKRDDLVPLRQPPPAPADSSTLLKANSLRHKNPPSIRRSASERSDGSSSHKSWEFIDNAESRKQPPASHSAFAGALASVGTMPAALGAPKATGDRSQPGSRPSSSRAGASSSAEASRQSPKSPIRPGHTRSKGDVEFRIPVYENQNRRVSMSPDEAAMVCFKDDNEVTNAVRNSIVFNTSPHASPPSKRPVSLYRSSTASSRKSYGPSHDFKEHHVSFESRSSAQSTLVESDSDSDSDGGLFAVPIANNDVKGKKVDGDSDSQSSNLGARRERPSLSLRTRSPRGHKTVSFSGESRNTDDDETPKGEVPPPVRQPNSARVPDSAQASAYTPDSPDETSKEFRRRSFYSDVWADRPAPETVAERLDEFFPNVDLDQPMLDPEEASPPASPTLTRKPAQKKSHEALRTTYISSTDDSDEEKDSETRKHSRHHDKHHPPSMAQRNIRRSVGIGRTKSIRDVVKSVYIPSHEAPPMPHTPGHPPPSARTPAMPGQRFPRDSVGPAPNRLSTLRKSDNMIRRRSTKMFGARIEQIKPQRGSRILETIPQDMPMPAQDNISTVPLKRQATFKWLKGQLIGKGTFGKVYLGFNTTTAELMAVKQVEVDVRRAGPDKEKIKEMVKALDQEIDTMQDLEHENIVAYLGCEREELKISIFLEYIDGGSIGSCLRKHGKFEEPVVSSLTRQTLQGLAYLHDKGILHRDLKADNILLTSDGICKISDFGISKKTDNIYGDDAQNTMQGSVFWMAPEVVRSQGAGYSAKVDIWSLGCVVLEMFAGRRPWAKDEAIGAIYKLGTLNQAPPIPDDVSKAIGPGAIGFMLDCFTIDPRDRPQAARLLEHEFCRGWQNFSFFDSELYQKIKPRD